MRKRRGFEAGCILAGLALAGCLPDMSPGPAPPKASRRLYVNDFAANDSLSAAVVRQGVYFILRPGKIYSLRLSTSFTGDRLAFYVHSGGLVKNLGVRDAVPESGGETFRLQSPENAWAYFTAQLLPADGLAAVSRLRAVRLVPVDGGESASLKVHLFMVGTFTGIPSADKPSFARSFLGELKSLFATYGVALDTSSESVQPNSRVVVDFNTTFTPLPGTRRPGTAHLYLVDSIRADMPGKTVLGFSPREAVDLDGDSTSRVLLSAVTVNPAQLAVTAAHELGHFFGLRHPTATSADMSVDNDQSNRDDGLASTSSCSSALLAKPAAGGAGYCLLTAGTAQDCPPVCAISNLMWAYSCSVSQRELTSEQQVLVRESMAMLQGK